MTSAPCLWLCHTPCFVSKATQKILIPGGPKYSQLSKIAYVTFQGKTTVECLLC